VRLPPGSDLTAPEFPPGLTWLNVAFLRMDKQMGRNAVLVEFWDFARVNSLRTLPYLKAWHDRYGDRGLRVVIAQAPGYSFGRDPEIATAAIERLGIESPVVQAGMGGGVARHELAAAVSEAGGLGTIGTLEPARLREELSAARRLTGAPLAINLLLPFSGVRHHEVAAGADVVVTFWGRPERHSERTWVHQCGSVEEARAAHVAGADAVIVQGVEAGGHVRGTTPALELLEPVKATLPRDFPVLVAGGVAEAADVRAVLEAGAAAAVLGTRFLLSEESHAHPAYKQAALVAEATVLTDLFGLGWPAARHRVLANAATSRWSADRGGVSPAVRAAQRALSPLTRVVPESAQRRFAAAQHPGVPLLSPLSPVDDAPCGRLLEAGALYAGETVARIADVRPAADVVAELTP